MGQDDVLTWLQAHPGWHRTATVAIGIRKPNRGSVYNALRAMAKHGEIRKRSLGPSAKCVLEWSA